MRVALIWPSEQSVLETVPLAYGLLYPALNAAGHEIKIFNCSLEGWAPGEAEFIRQITEFAPDVVGATGWPTTVASAFASVRAVQVALPDAVYVIGGNYATLNPEVTWETGLFDYIIRYEAEDSFCAFLRCLEDPDNTGMENVPGIYYQRDDRSMVKTAPVQSADLDAIAQLDYEIIELERYFDIGYMRTVLGKERKAPIFATRGCPYTCSFCTVWLNHGRVARHHSAGFLVEQIRHLYDHYGVRHINFMDDNPTHDMDFWKGFCKAVIDAEFKGLVLENHRGVRLEHLDPELLNLTRRAGFKHVIIAPETGSGRARDLMQKTMETDTIREAARMVHESGLGLHGFFMLGYPGETREDRLETYRFIRELKFDAIKIHKFVALPGTPSFNKLVKEGKVARDYTPDGSYLLGNEVPNFNCDPEDKQLDREIFIFYAKFYLSAPWKFIHVLHMSPLKMVFRAFSGLCRGLVGSLRPARGGEPPGQLSNESL